MKITYEDVKSRVPMAMILEKYHIELDKSSRCACPIHEGKNKSAFAVHDQGRKWTCHTTGCGKGASVIDFVALRERITVPEAFIKLKEWYGMEEEPSTPSTLKPVRTETGRTDLIYLGEDGEELYKIVRATYSDGHKAFFQEKGQKKEDRVLYNLNAIAGSGADFVCLAEGEKTADAISSCGFIGTTFSGGCNGWEDHYADMLEDKIVVLMPDADEEGEKWLDKVSKGLAGRVESLSIITVPDKFILKYPQYKGHDFADMLAEGGAERSTEWLTDQYMKADKIPRGIDRADLNVMTDVCSAAAYNASNRTDADGMNLEHMFGSEMRVMVRPADLMMIIAPTGVGKTRVLANMMFQYTNLNFMVFDLELSRDQIGMRGIAYHNDMSYEAADSRCQNGLKMEMPTIENVFVPRVGNLTTKKIKEEVDRVEAMQERKIHVVAIDYISKMNAMGKMQESIIQNCIEFKRYLVEENRIGIITTQSKRIQDKVMKYNMPRKEDAIFTSTLEQNCQQAMCFCFVNGDHNTMLVRCDKYTNGAEPKSWIEMDVADMRMKYRGVHHSSGREWE